MTPKEARIQLALGTATPRILFRIILGLSYTLNQRFDAIRLLIRRHR
jgi:hypothetical protein